MFDLYKQLPDCNLEGIQMGITARQWIKIYYMAVFILDPCGTQCELWQHPVPYSVAQVQGIEKNHFQECVLQSSQRRGPRSEMSTHFRARLTWLHSGSSQGVGTCLIFRRI